MIEINLNSVNKIINASRRFKKENFMKDGYKSFTNIQNAIKDVKLSQLMLCNLFGQD